MFRLEITRAGSTPTRGKAACLALVAIAVGSQAQNLPVPPLPYSYSALVPFISEHALRVRSKTDVWTAQLQTRTEISHDYVYA